MRDRRVAIVLATLLVLSTASTLTARPTSAESSAVAATTDPFPDLEALQPNVEFWTEVFGDWSLGQVAIHDLEFPAIVYEVVDLPGPVEPRYTDHQKDWVEALREDWERFLLKLERKVAAGDPLEKIEKQWALYFATRVGGDKLKGAHKRVRSQRGMRERFRAGLERSFHFDAAIRRIMREYGLPEDLAYLPHVESSFQYHARSTAGAAGMWQFTRGTGKRYMTINSALDERLDPIAATRGAAQYLRDAYEKLETWPLALTSYNHGVHGMQRAKDRFGTDFEKIYREYDGRIWGFASKNFYAEFLAARKVAQQADTFFPEGYTPEAPFDLDSIRLESRATPLWISMQYGIAFDELAALNLAWSKRTVNNALHLPKDTEVWLPAGTLQNLQEQGKTIRAPAPDENRETYVVRRGETLSGIAAAHGVPVSALRQANGLSARSSLIQAGQTLRLPAAATSRNHVVRRGETLTRIATRYGVRLGDLLSANTLTLKSIIHPGQVLQIPH